MEDQGQLGLTKHCRRIGIRVAGEELRHGGL